MFTIIEFIVTVMREHFDDLALIKLISIQFPLSLLHMGGKDNAKKSFMHSCPVVKKGTG